MRKISLAAWILISLVAGIAFGALFPKAAVSLGVLGSIFLRLIKSIIAPLLFGTLVSGIAGAGNIKTMGRIGAKAIVYFEIVTTIALFVGLGAANLVQPGAGVELRAGQPADIQQTSTSLSQILEHTFPASIIDAMARGEVLQIVVFSFMFGAACSAIGDKAAPVVQFCESLSEVMFRYTNYVMFIAPLGVFGAMAATIGEHGLNVLLSLGKLVGTLYAAQAFFLVIVLGTVATIVRVPIRRFVAHVRQPFLIAFSTASSEAALPLALENMERFGVPKHIVAFVLPTGYSFNLDGSTLYLSLAALFVAQAAGVHLAFGTQIVMMLTLMLTSKGVAGVPRASLVILAGTLATFNLPVEGIAVILGVDTLMDMCRTSVNLLGNCLATAVVARWEGVDLKAAERESIAEPAAV
ncbi:MAG: cation:dicarboxylase symporter family transporter [Bryobacterales bacterium]|nr:cation:dicarboxylase symporter family transporter [Bryobacterales bacterium]MBV9401394.1 cation:dicarboxylase symporter family transporter [Bryobacterales bacterium]